MNWQKQRIDLRCFIFFYLLYTLQTFQRLYPRYSNTASLARQSISKTGISSNIYKDQLFVKAKGSKLFSQPPNETVPADRVDEIKDKLSKIIDPDSGNDIVSAGVVSDIEIKSDNSILVKLLYKDPSSVIILEIKKLCIIELTMAMEWVNNIDIVILPKATESMNRKLNNLDELQGISGMAKIKNIIAVSSCKGGVGKSTVSVNLAYTLSRAGARVGILDADIYGPSLPTMTKPLSTDILLSTNKMMIPLEFQGVKLMSMGFLSKGAAIMRGPMVNQILNQFVQLCDWGELDYLVIDMPPGTGDIQLTLAQIMNITAAVIVTTPQRLSFVDVVKGIDMFDTVNVPCIAVVENMAQFNGYDFPDEFYDTLSHKLLDLANRSQGSLDSRDIRNLLKISISNQEVPLRVFGSGHTSRLRDMWGIENIVTIPIDSNISNCGDNGTPCVLQYTESKLSQAMEQLAVVVVNEIEAMQIDGGKYKPSKIEYINDKNTIRINNIKSISPFKLRNECRCALCVEEFTGEKILDVNKIPRDVSPRSFAPIGRYAVSIDWSDGHKSLFPFKQIDRLIS